MAHLSKSNNGDKVVIVDSHDDTYYQIGDEGVLLERDALWDMLLPDDPIWKVKINGLELWVGEDEFELKEIADSPLYKALK